LGRDAAARREFEKALELDPHGCPVRQALALPCG
jgi:Flp pilus assembly protein TadD